ncbi:MAG: Ribosomal RNA large subunit methyltransferase E [Candidatus Thorarchaeota archaeon AB_25]|jgi:23S rRNA (uridine2552-2'-O)-methyltransferase|nr:MAG: Ribosomal RNA large subunit methyltransferase E [Candidatus Thorarchaeota archaeon AB_25]
MRGDNAMGRPRGGEKQRKKEHYYQAAKRHGYRSRSAYKLRQIAKDQKLLQGVDRVVELCSSPGGWTQVLKEIDSSLQIVAVDLTTMPPLEGVKFIEGDILDEKIIERIETLTGGTVDLVLSDCSPKVTGQWDLDVVRQLSLVEGTISIAHRLLSNKGKVLTKVFQGPGFPEFLKSVRKKFNSVKLIKPDASRKTSAEMYLLAIGPRGRSPHSVS